MLVLSAMTDLKTTTRAEWNELKDSKAPWADFESEYYMQAVPTSWVTTYGFDHFKNLMESRDIAMKGIKNPDFFFFIICFFFLGSFISCLMCFQ